MIKTVVQNVVAYWWPVFLVILTSVPPVVGLFIAWRALRAHERLASAVQRMARGSRLPTTI